MLFCVVHVYSPKIETIIFSIVIHVAINSNYYQQQFIVSIVIFRLKATQESNFENRVRIQNIGRKVN